VACRWTWDFAIQSPRLCPLTSPRQRRIPLPIQLRPGTLFEKVAVAFGHGHPLALTIFLMRVHLDAEKCQGHNRCYALAPELFDVDDYGKAILIVEGDVPAELHDKARLAASNCPEYAITITENR
jgi:ferredoxin